MLQKQINFIKRFKENAKFAVLGLNPHCETIDSYSEEEEIIKPSIEVLKRKK